jgi:hypothetical protein
VSGAPLDFEPFDPMTLAAVVGHYLASNGGPHFDDAQAIAASEG